MGHRTRTAVLGSALAVAALGFAAPGATAAPQDITVEKVTVNGGKPVVLGTTAAKTFKVTVTAATDSAFTDTDITLYGPNFAMASSQGDASCSFANGKSTCTATYTIDPDTDFYDNTPAGGWYVNALLQSDTDSVYAEKTGAFKVQRESKLTVNASPEPIKKGKTLTVTGALTRANWETHKFSGYTKQSVTLEYKKKGASAYSAVKTVKSDTKGNLKTTVKATADGSYRWSFAGNSTTPAVKAAGDAVDVR
ncbi:calcium-binding protein [Streptomyces sp. CC224B]|uniref:calcium-binding protein n=1 Tax=Streptomyces sp. CC224B TaxID=3044571 RepID=UPI0024A7BB00|nr:calcium-binding protein [Streptomyces sp. CC224B]